MENFRDSLIWPEAGFFIFQKPLRVCRCGSTSVKLERYDYPTYARLTCQNCGRYADVKYDSPESTFESLIESWNNQMIDGLLLKPCKICGDVSISLHIEKWAEGEGKKDEAYMSCNRCNHIGPRVSIEGIIYHQDIRNKAVKAWNDDFDKEYFK